MSLRKRKRRTAVLLEENLNFGVRGVLSPGDRISKSLGPNRPVNSVFVGFLKSPAPPGNLDPINCQSEDLGRITGKTDRDYLSCKKNYGS